MTNTSHQHLDSDGFRLRGMSMSRIDGFSDVVFGFALTLLVVSLEVPKTFGELNGMLRGFIPFAICFFFLISIWWEHYTFFRRFGLHDTRTIQLNAALLFVVLFYVYPLKFLFTFALVGSWSAEQRQIATGFQITELMILYGVGWTAIYLLLSLMYRNAIRQELDPPLSPEEGAAARMIRYEDAAVGAVGLLSCIVALLLPRGVAGMAGWTYLLIWPVRSIFGRRRRRLRLAHEMATPFPNTAETSEA